MIELKTMTASAATTQPPQEVQIKAGSLLLNGELNVPANATGIVLFAHGSGSSRHSPRNQYVATVIRNAGVGTLLFDLLTRDEEVIDNYTREFRFDIKLLARRLVAANSWLAREKTGGLRAGYFGASTGGGAALVAAAELEEKVGAVVSRGGRPDLAGPALSHVTAPTLLIVGGLDGPVIRMNEDAYSQLRCVKELKIIPGATHLFEEPGKLEEVASLAAKWFLKHLQ
ncbi:MAG TPA: hypothetical protein VF074_18935 [Pyrinomonadaceae bacterium]